MNAYKCYNVLNVLHGLLIMVTFLCWLTYLEFDVSFYLLKKTQLLDILLVYDHGHTDTWAVCN